MDKQAVLDRAAALLGEHFDTVRIFATYRDDDGQTIGCSQGVGNYYAQRGQVTEWCQQQDARVNVDVQNREGWPASE